MNDQRAFTLEDHEAQGQYLSNKDISEAVLCGVNVLSLINIDIEKVGASIWSYEEGSPKNDLKEENVCVYLKSNGRWMNGFCDDKTFFACDDKKKPGNWKITTKKGMWDQGEEICNESFEGSHFYAPKNGGSHKSLLNSSNKNFPVWINQLVSKNKWPGYYAIVPHVSGRPLFGWYKNVRQWSWMNNTFQMWTFVPREEDLFLLKNVKTGMCMSVSFGLSENAANRIKEIMSRAEKDALGVRVSVKSGGCAGMSYVMEYSKKLNPNDEVIEDKGVKVFIDSAAVMYLLGTEMDYKKEEFSSTFVFNNPNETERCGCGESFKVN